MLANEISKEPCRSGIGIGHTRWATHGPATISNAHPHVGGEEVLALAHNGVIENFAELRTSLQEKGYKFVSETDTEVIAHLIADNLKGRKAALTNGSPLTHQDCVEAFKEVCKKLRGTYGVVAIFKQWPDAIFAARLGSPLVIGIGEGEHFIASDASPLAGFTDRIVYLCLLYTSPSPRDQRGSRMPSSA